MDHSLERSQGTHSSSAELSKAAGLHSDAIRKYEAALRSEHAMPFEERARLRLGLADAFYQCNRLHESCSAVEPFLEGDECDLETRASSLVLTARAKLALGQLEVALKRAGEASSLLRDGSSHGTLSDALRWTGYALLQRGDVSGAYEALRDALAAARRCQDEWRETCCYRALGNLSRQRGEYRQAVRYHAEALQRSKQLGLADSHARELLHLGLAKLYLGDLVDSGEHLGDALRRYSELDYARGVISCHISLSRLHLRRGDRATSEKNAEQARVLAEGTGPSRSWVLSYEALGDVQAVGDDPAGAAQHFESALSAAREISPTGDLVYEIEWRLGLAYLELGRLVEADELCRDAVNLARAGSDPRETGNALAALARVQAARGDDAFFDTIHEALTIFRELQLPWELAETYLTAARLCREANRGEPGAWLAYEHSARRLRARLGLEADVDSADPATAEPEPMTVVLENGVELLARSPSMVRMIETARDLAQIDNTVLIQGETGTGKELIARLIHDDGPRREKPFVAINCAAIAEALLESELFGHRRGAFTGADRDRRGHLVAAGEGTVFLDEIDKAPAALQAKLLRVLEDRQVLPVGSSAPVPLRARLLFAANRDLQSLVERGDFLPDLFYRLAGIKLVLPPLRERPEDVSALVRFVLQKMEGVHRDEPYVLSKSAREAIQAYDWPGNVRELRHVLEAATFFARADGVIDLLHLPEAIRSTYERDRFYGLPQLIEQLERREIVRALERSEGNKTQAARILGVTRKGLGDRIRRLGLDS
ncbi:MAG: sigma 54-interacting transcriptional regulator [bacterium]